MRNPNKDSPIRSFSRIARRIEWLLLHPDEESLFFIEEDAPSRLIEYTFRNEHFRVVTASVFWTSQPPVWLDNSRLLVTSAGELASVDIQTGNMIKLMDMEGFWALSPDLSRLLVNVKPTVKNPINFILYEFPSLRLIKTVHKDTFAKYDGIRIPFCFIDNERILLGLRKDWWLAEMFTALHLFDVRTMQYRKVGPYVDNLFYVPE